jgi:glycosyltransferase involved in cell wall biosynthesis
VVWLDRARFGRIAEVGCLFTPQPDVAQLAWMRRFAGARRYSLCGLTHTTASHGLQAMLADLLLAPVEPWDALICTSSAVQASIETELESVWAYLAGRLGAAKRPPVRLQTIPLGLNTADFAHDPEQRRRWRDALRIPAEAVAVLYVGRFSYHAKMSPGPMAMALERAARATGREIHWILCGWSPNEAADRAYHATLADKAPSVTMHVVDGRKPDVRFSIWSAGDIFLSLSDNIQETFGLTPVEAMAAGLPSVISDWDGYRDTVRHGVDGFRIPTYAPRPGLGADLALRYAAGWDNYSQYLGIAAQFVAVDIDEAAGALVRLIQDPALRAEFGANAQRRAIADFDWRAIIPRYQALWAELAQIRTAATAETRAVEDPWKLDPFKLFASYPTEPLLPDARLTAHPHATGQIAAALLGDPQIQHAAHMLPRAEEVQAILSLLSAAGAATAAEVVRAFPPVRQGFVERGLLWLAKHGLVAIEPTRPIRR